MVHFPDLLVYGNDIEIRKIDPSASVNTPNAVVFARGNTHVCLLVHSALVVSILVSFGWLVFLFDSVLCFCSI
jgi:hypothetical protein